MSYSDFTLSTVKKAFDLILTEEIDLFAQVEELKASPFLQEILQENIPLALATNTEKIPFRDDYCSNFN